MSRIVFVENNPFGSRLHVLTPLLLAAQKAGHSATVIFPARVDDDHWREWRDAVGGVANLCSVEAFRKPLLRSQRATRRSLSRLLSVANHHVHEGDQVILTGLDDCLGAALLCLGRLGRLARVASDAYVLRYRAEVVFARPKSPRQLFVKLSILLIRRVMSAWLVVFDERLRGSRPYVAWLPDPWTGLFGVLERSSARAMLGIPADVPVIGLIGKQDRRKGFPTAAAAIQLFNEQDSRIWCIVLGRVESAFAGEFSHLQRTLGHRLVHQEAFVPDSELPTYFASCDVILLPYAEDFSASSGVLVRAAATGVPVVASEHGLVGHRVRAHGLGEVVAYGDDLMLARSTQRLLSESSHYRCGRARAWASSCREEVVVEDAARLFSR